MSVVPIITRRAMAEGNPGDVFIGWGLQYLVQQVRPEAQILLIDKFSDTDFRRYKRLLAGTQILYAGMPQYNNLDDWCLWYDWEMFRDYLVPLRTRVLSVAGGSGYPDPRVTPQEFSAHCLKSQKTRNVLRTRSQITDLSLVRDQHSYQLLQDFGMPVRLLPCTALWAADHLGMTDCPEPTRTIGLVPPSPGHINPQILGLQTSTEAMQWFVCYFDEIRKQLSHKGYKVRLICNAFGERAYFEDWDEVFYTNDPVCLMRAYSDVDGVISARVHGAIPVAGFYKPAVLLGIDSRCSVADPIGIPKLIVGHDDLYQAVDLLLNQDSRPYISAIEAARREYLDVLNAHLL